MPKPYDENQAKQIFSERFRHYYEKSGKTQSALADLLEVKPKTVAAYLAGSIQPKMDGVMRICNVFKISSDELLRRETDGPAPQSGSDSDKVFSAAQKKAMEDAARNVLDPAEDAFEIEQGQGIVKHRILGMCRVPMDELKEVIASGQAAYAKEVERLLRKKMDEAEKRAVYQNEIELCNQALEKEILKDGEAAALRKEYADYCKIIQGAPADKNEWIPFHSYREALFFVFFIQKDPFPCIETELVALKYRDLKPKSKQELYQKMLEKLGAVCNGSRNYLLEHLAHGSTARPTFVVDAYLRSIGSSREAMFERLGAEIDRLLLPAEKMSEDVDDYKTGFFYHMVSLLYRKLWNGGDVEDVLEYVEVEAKAIERKHITVPRMKAD